MAMTPVRPKCIHCMEPLDYSGWCSLCARMQPSMPMAPSTPSVTVLKKPVDPDVVNYLRDILKEAEEGKVRGFLIVRQNDESGIQYTVVGVEDRLKLLGFLTHALFKLNTD